MFLGGLSWDTTEGWFYMIILFVETLTMYLFQQMTSETTFLPLDPLNRFP